MAAVTGDRINYVGEPEIRRATSKFPQIRVEVRTLTEQVAIQRCRIHHNHCDLLRRK